MGDHSARSAQGRLGIGLVQDIDIMELIVLGSGTAIPLNYRGSPALVLRIGREQILLDMGPGTLRQLKKAGLSPEHIGRIFLTHFHPDHSADLVHFLFATRNPSILMKREPFVIIGASGLKQFIKGLQKVYHDWLTLPSEIMEIEELDVGRPIKRDYGSFEITARASMHTPNSLAYRLKSQEGKSVVYSGDTDFSEEIVDLAKGADLLILECSFPDGQEVAGHLTPSKAGRIADLAGVDKLLLTHFYPECLRIDAAAQCRTSYGGELILASDLLHIHI
jgi:ribonuclease BN (tRNA processing enzyme)